MTQTLNVEKEELLARAAELEAALPVSPPDNPQAACALPMVIDGATQLGLSADSMRLYFKAGEREWRRLAESLRNAAKAYEDVDEEAADAVTNNSSVSAATPGSPGGGAMMTNCDPDEDFVLPPPAPPPPPPQYPYYEVRQAATDIEAPDQGTAFSAMARDWDTYQRSLQSVAYRFRPFSQWEGQSAMVVEANFEAQRTWIYQMAQLCSQLAAQASTAAAAHKWAITQHPSAYEVSEADKWYLIYTTDPYYKANPFTQQYIWRLYEWYDTMQKKSEEVLTEYGRRASFPLMPVNPKAPPMATRIEPPPPAPKPGEGGDGGESEIPDDGIPDDGLPIDDGSLPSVPSAPSTPTPSLPSTGVPSMPDNAALNEALQGLQSQSPSAAGMGAGMKPAAVGGGGGGGGMPSMPLQPSVNAESASGSGPNVARDAPNMGRVAAAGAAAGGGGGMGMAPMGAGGAGAGQGGEGKGKRAQGTEESLYSEERPWTEGVIGNRRRKDVSDSKDSK